MTAKNSAFRLINKYGFAAAVIALCLVLLWSGLKLKDNLTDNDPVLNDPDQGYVILAANDYGMHCIQRDYSSFLILPPGNNLQVQVFKKGAREAKMITQGIEVRYEMLDNTTSADKTNFWDYAKDYGFNVPPNIGITGNGLKGVCTLSKDKKYYEATAIPVVPYNDNSTKRNPYQVARITVADQKTGAVLAVSSEVVIPVSDEMDCYICHGTTDTDANILKAHDKLSKTNLYQDLQNNIRHKCNECHQDNILGAKGKEGVPPLSQAAHGFHASKMELSPVESKCYSCHPGRETQCYRGIMYTSGVPCDTPQCHGNMEQIAASQKAGRQAWIQESDCGNCHSEKYANNPSMLYSDSYLLNGPAPEMNGIILCMSCHNSSHAVWPSSLPIDNALPISLLGYASYINQCTVCHQGSGTIHH